MKTEIKRQVMQDNSADYKSEDTPGAIRLSFMFVNPGFTYKQIGEKFGEKTINDMVKLLIDQNPEVESVESHIDIALADNEA